MALSKVYLNFTTSLASGISSAASSLTLARSTDDDGTTLSGSYILTVDEGTNSEEHMLVSLSGATGTITTRGLSRVDATTNVAANQFAHSRGATVKITNAPLVKVVNRLNGDEAFDSVDLTGIQSIAGLSTPTVGETTKAANVEYVNNSVVAGGVDASTTVKGILKLSTAPASATDPIAVGTNDNRVSPVSLATVTSDIVDALDGTGTPSSSSKYVTNDDTATTSTADKVVRADGSGLIDESWLPSVVCETIATMTADVSTTNSTTETTLLTGTLSADKMGSSGAILAKVFISDLDCAQDNWTFRLKLGSTTIASVTFSATNNESNKIGSISASIVAAGSTSSQIGAMEIRLSGSDTDLSSSSNESAVGIGTGTGSEDTTGDLTFSITSQVDRATPSSNITATSGYALVMRS